MRFTDAVRRSGRDYLRIELFQKGRLFYLGLLNHQEGDFSAARICLQESLARSREVDDKLEVVRVLVELARLEVDEHDAASARQHLADAVRLGRERLGIERSWPSALAHWRGC